MAWIRFFLLFCLLAPQRSHADLIVLLSDAKPSIMGVAEAIQSQYKGRLEIYNLNGDPGRSREFAAIIRNSAKKQVVAVGLLASRTARQNFSAKEVVFCQVLNYREFDLVTPWMKGVSAIPSLKNQFQTWKQLAPNLKSVGVVASRSMSDIVHEAAIAARESNIELIPVEAESDREVMPALSGLAPKIQGLWIAPDSRILSGNVLMDLMSYSGRQGIQTLVFSPSLLKEGGLLSATQDLDEIARSVLDRLKHFPGGNDVEPLSAANMSINAKAAARFGLAIPQKLKGLASEK